MTMASLRRPKVLRPKVMEISAIVLARALYFIESLELNPKGKLFYPDLIAALVERCGFRKFPEGLEHFDEAKGVEFVAGKWGDTVVERFKIYNNGLQVDTRVSTAESERIMNEAIEWAINEFGIAYTPQMLSRKAYVSDLVFRTEVPLLTSYSPITNLCRRGHAALGEISRDKMPWQPIILTMQSEGVPRKPVHAPLTIQRRAEAAFSENKYYSEAPLPTDVHIRLLEQFEADVLTA
jgi:hypothetical protein